MSIYVFAEGQVHVIENHESLPDPVKKGLITSTLQAIISAEGTRPEPEIEDRVKLLKDGALALGVEDIESAIQSQMEVMRSTMSNERKAF